MFHEVEGMDEINKLEPVEIRMISPHCFEVNIDTTEFSPYGCRGRGKLIFRDDLTNAYQPTYTTHKNA